MTDLKQKIAASFSARAEGYDLHAVVQKQAAGMLTDRLAKLQGQVPKTGPILEFGCGTGAVSRHLPRLFPGQPLTLMDIAPGMIRVNRQALTPFLAPGGPVNWQVGDAELIEARPHYALILSCLTLQWFNQPAASLARLCQALAPGGLLICSFLTEGSFPEWHAVCRELNLACTANPLPRAEEARTAVSGPGREVSLGEETLELTYPTALDFFRSLKETGTRTAARAHRLTPGEMRRLLARWPKEASGQVLVTYQLATLLVRTPS